MEDEKNQNKLKEIDTYIDSIMFEDFQIHSKKQKLSTEELMINIQILNKRIKSLCETIETLNDQIVYYDTLNQITSTLPNLKIEDNKKNYKKRGRECNEQKTI